MRGDYDLVERNIGDLLQILSRLVTELFSKATLSETTPHKLSQPQLSMLTLLDAVGRKKISDLCRVHHISAPAGTKNVDKLESLRLVRRVAVNGDRRSVWVGITPDGSTLVQNFHEAYLDKVRYAIANLSEEDQRLMIRLVEGIITRGIQTSSQASIICLHCQGRFSDSCILQEHYQRCLYLESDLNE